MSRRIIVATFSAIFVFLTGSVAAWETKTIENPKDSWQSIYINEGDNPRRALRRYLNEHPYLGEMALKELGVEKTFGFAAKSMDVLDLNASIFRVWLRDRGRVPMRPRNEPLETRRIPAPAQFTGIPDYSYAIHDWINKNTMCPAKIPEGSPFYDRCYIFQGWMGALNANHFGSQATSFYHHIHELARNLARHAKSLRETFQDDPAALEVYGDYVREAEREAMAVEGYAQHFLQDRWSMGHMWERWNASDIGDMPYKDMFTNMEIAAASGLLHGSEATFGMPDGMSGPYVSLGGRDPVSKRIMPDKWAYIMPTWRHHRSNLDQEIMNDGVKTSQEYPGAGDDRLADAIDHRFGKKYKVTVGRDFPYEVGDQKRQMLNCSIAGWVEVIRDFGPNPKGGFGVDRLQPKGGITGFHDKAFVKDGCFDIWATNRTMVLGWMDSISSVASLMRVAIGFSQDAMRLIQGIKKVKDAIPVVKDWSNPKGISQNLAKWTVGTEKFKKNSPAWLTKKIEDGNNVLDEADKAIDEADFQILKTNRFAWLQIHYRFWKHRFKNKNGTELARGALGSFSQAKQGGAYDKIASYTEPVDLETLPDKDQKFGKDKQAWYGLFNRSHAAHWCTEADDLINKLRRQNSATGQAACRLLADRLYTGTNPRYQGKQREDRVPVASLCSYMGRQANAKSRSDQPVSLPPGYVEPKLLQKKSDDNLSYRSIANWCARVPVIAMVNGPEADEDVVVIVKNPKKPVQLQGFDFDNNSGRLKITGPEGEEEISGQSVVSWEDDKIRFRLSKTARQWKNGDYPITVILPSRDHGQSVGRFLMRIKRERPKVVAVKVIRDWDKTVRYNHHPKQNKISERIHPETFRLKVRFDIKMDTETDPKVSLTGFDLPISGKWLSAWEWEASFTLLDNEKYDRHIGSQALVFSAKAESGAWLDTDLDREGDQPDKTHRLRISRLPPAPPAMDLTGCYEWDSHKLHIVANGGQLTGRASWKLNNKPSFWFDVNGEYMPPNITLRHRYTPATARGVLGDYAPHMIDRALKAEAKVEYRLKAFASKTPAGELEPSVLSGDVEIYKQTFKVPVPSAGGKAPALVPLKTPSTMAQYRRLDGRGYEMESLRISDRDGKEISKTIGRDQPFWITAKAQEGCPIVAERIYLAMGYQENRHSTRWITLVETAKDSRIFMSPKAGIQIPYNVPEDETHEIVITSPDHQELKYVYLKVKGSDQPWVRNNLDEFAPLRPVAQPVQVPGSPMSKVPEGVPLPPMAALTPSVGSANNTNPVASSMETDKQSLNHSRRQQLKVLRDNAERMRQQAHQLSGPGRNQALMLADKLSAQADQMEKSITQSEKSATVYSNNAGKSPKLSPDQWRVKLSKQIEYHMSSIKRQRQNLARTKDPEDRLRIEKNIRIEEATIERLKQVIARQGGKAPTAKAANVAEPPSAQTNSKFKSSTADLMSRNFRTDYDRMKRRVENGWAEVKKLEAKAATAGSADQKQIFESRAKQWRRQTENMATDLSGYLGNARKTFQMMKQPTPKWIDEATSNPPAISIGR